jgi:thymidine kinase
MSGRLELIIGPMFSGKSTELIKHANRYISIGKNVLAINHKINNRYGSNKITTHDKKVFENCIIIDKLNDIHNLYTQKFNDSEIIIIEELQFFPDGFDFIKNTVDFTNKTVITAGLSGDFRRNPFGDVLKLIPYADSLTQLSAYCKKCGDGTLANFTKRITKENNTTLVGTADQYEAVCRKHYLEN